MPITDTLRNEQWYYDDSGYYSYVLLDGTEQKLAEVQDIFKRAGFRVLLAGRSHRPARNNRQYQWYIRVARGDSGEISKPSLEEITKVLSPDASQDSQQVPSFAFVMLESKLADDHHENLEARNQHLEALLALARSQLRQLGSEVEHLQAVQERFRSLSVKWSDRGNELRTYRRENADLKAQLVRILGEKQTSDKETGTTGEYEAAVQQMQQMQQQLENREAEFSQWLAMTDQELEDHKREITELTNQLAVLYDERASLLEKVQRLQTVEMILPRVDGSYELFRKTVQSLMPEVELVGGSFEVLWQGVPDPPKILQQISKLDQVKGTRVRGAPAWLERHIEGDWRIYYRQSTSSGKCYALVSHKKSQKSDIEWLKCQPVD